MKLHRILWDENDWKEWLKENEGDLSGNALREPNLYPVLPITYARKGGYITKPFTQVMFFTKEDFLRLARNFDKKVQEVSTIAKPALEISEGDSVLVPAPENSDYWNGEFVGIVQTISGDNAVVIDQEGNVFDVDLCRLSLVKD